MYWTSETLNIDFLLLYSLIENVESVKFWMSVFPFRNDVFVVPVKSIKEQNFFPKHYVSYSGSSVENG